MGFRVPQNRNSPAYFKGSNTALITSGGLEFKDGTVVHPYAGNPNGVLVLPIGSLVLDRLNAKLYQATDSLGAYAEVGSGGAALTFGRGLTGVGTVGDPVRMSGEYHPAIDGLAWEIRKANGTTAVLQVNSTDGTLVLQDKMNLGKVDAFGRTMVWNYGTNSVLKLGSLAQDGDPTDVSSEGIVLVGANSSGAFDHDNWAFARLKSTRIGINNCVANVQNYIFRADEVGMYLRADGGSKTFEVTRSTGLIKVSGEIRPLIDSSTAIQFKNAGGTLTYFTLDSLTGLMTAGSAYVPTDAKHLVTKDYVDSAGETVYNNRVQGNVYYVAPAGNNINSGNSVPSAFLTIQHAIDTAAEGDTILVYPGTYEIAAEISCNKGLTILGIGGPEQTIIQPTLGTQIRCMYIYETKLAKIVGFTFRNGYTTLAGAGVNPGNGGGICIWQSVGVSPSVIGSYVKDCIFENCYAQQYGGGAYMMDHKSAAISCIARNCSTATGALYGGGGIALRWEGYAFNCLIYDCSSQYGGGIMCHSGVCRIDNCTVVDCTGGGGIVLHNAGVGGHQVYNCISYYNAGSNISIVSSTGDIRHTCSTPLPAGINNVSAAPEFVNRGADDYQIETSSILNHYGLRRTWHDSFPDLSGNKIKHTISLGCYNYDNSLLKELNIYGYLERNLKTYFDTLYGGGGAEMVASNTLSGEQNVAPDTEVVLVDYTVPVGKKLTILNGNGSSDGEAVWRITWDGVTKAKLRNAHQDRNVALLTPLELPAGAVLQVLGKNVTLEAATNEIGVWLHVSEVNV